MHVVHNGAVKKTKENRRNTLRPEVVQACRTGYTRLVKVSDFRREFLQFKADLSREVDAAGAGDAAGCDISMGDIRVRTPQQEVEDAIQARAQEVEEQEAEEFRRMQERQRAKDAARVARRARARSRSRRGRAGGDGGDGDEGGEEEQEEEGEGEGEGEGQDEEQQQGKGGGSSGKAEAEEDGGREVEEADDDDEEDDEEGDEDEDEDDDDDDDGGAAALRAGANLPPSERVVSTDGIPKYAELQDRVKELQRRRKKELGTRARREPNAATSMLVQTHVDAMVAGKAPVPVSPTEVVLRVAIFHPEHFFKSQEFLVLGSQRLTHLKDRISTPKEDADMDGLATSSSCFFIENKFYNDVRGRRAAVLYSDPVVRWVQRDGRYVQPGLSHFETGVMADTTFNDLSIRLGSHYMFQQMGDEQYTIMFTEMRMVTADDEQNANAYPLMVFQSKARRRKCRVCDLFPARYVTYGDRLAHENPFFYCETCYKMYHYDASGTILYDDFAVYRFSHD